MKITKIYSTDDDLLRILPIYESPDVLAFIKLFTTRGNDHVNINVDYINELINLLEQVKNDWRL